MRGRTARILARIAPAILLASGLAACGGGEGGGPAAACAEVVRLYADLQGRVQVVGKPAQSSEGSVEISYQGMGAMNTPVKGKASCTFAVDEGGSLTLLEAIVDDTPLGEGEIASIRSELGERH